MMGRQPNQQQKMFYDRINLDQRIRSDHVLRQITQHLDFDFIYNEVQETYGANGNVSVPPPVILKKTQPVSWLRKITLGNSPSRFDTFIHPKLATTPYN